MKKISVLFLFCLGFLQAQIPTNGLLAYYPFIGNANDYSGNAQNATVNGATLTADRFGSPNNAYSFNGTSDYISLPTASLVGLNIYSYSLWFRPANANNNGRILSIGESGPIGQSLFRQNTGALVGSSFNTGTTPSLSLIQSNPAPNGQWSHVVVVRNNTAIRMFVNGVAVNGGNNAATNSNADYGTLTPMLAVLGSRSSLANGSFFHGLIDDVRIYGVALTQTEVAALYNEPECLTSVPLLIAPSSTLCSGGSVSLTSLAGGNNTIKWFASPTSSTSLGSGSTYVVSGLQVATSMTTYTVFAESNDCYYLPRTAVTLTVHALPQLTVISTSTLLCIGESATLSVAGADAYIWNDNPNTYSIGSHVVVSPKIATTYSILATGLDGCQSTTTVQLLASECTGFSKLETSTALLRIYPEITSDVLNVSFINGDGGELSIYNASGSMVCRIPQQGNTVVNVSDLAPGMYVLRLTGNTAAARKFFKQ